MSSAESRPLVEDPALLGGARILSRPRLEEWLSESLGRPCEVTPRRLRYKPGTSAVLAFDLYAPHQGLPQTQQCIARAYADHASPKATKTRDQLPPGACLALDESLNVLVTTAAGDRDLPLLRRLGTPDGSRQVVSRLLAGQAVDGQARIVPIRHNPERRWVGALRRHDQAPLLLRAYPGKERLAGAAASYRAFAKLDDVRTPRVVGRSRSLALLVVSWAEGHELTTSPDLAAWSEAGRALGLLHAHRGGHRLEGWQPSVTDAVGRAAREIARLVPELSDEVRYVADTTARLLQALPPGHSVLHGDFSADQVVMTEGRPSLIDLDAARHGPSSYDLGCLTASTLGHAEQSARPELGAARVAEFLEGYGKVRRLPDPFDIGVQTVAFRIRKAVDPFRDCDPDWRIRMTAAVAAARATLEHLPARSRA